MITDARALKPRSVPQDMVHRDSEIDHLAAALDPIASENVSIFNQCQSYSAISYLANRLSRTSKGCLSPPHPTATSR